MTEVENFTGTKKDKRYLFLDEMLTRNLIKLDNIETEGKENIRQARKEAIRCIEKCIAVLEAKADSNGKSAAQPQQQDVEMKEENTEPGVQAQPANGEVDIKEAPKEDKLDSQPERIDEPQPLQEIKEDSKREATPKPQEEPKPETEAAPSQPVEAHISDTRPAEPKPEAKLDEQKKEVENKSNSMNPMKELVKKRNKRKEASKDSTEEASKDSNKTEVAQKEVMQVDDKGDKPMEVDGAASQ